MIQRDQTSRTKSVSSSSPSPVCSISCNSPSCEGRERSTTFLADLFRHLTSDFALLSYGSCTHLPIDLLVLIQRCRAGSRRHSLTIYRSTLALLESKIQEYFSKFHVIMLTVLKVMGIIGNLSILFGKLCKNGRALSYPHLPKTFRERAIGVGRLWRGLDSAAKQVSNICMYQVAHAIEQRTS